MRNHSTLFLMHIGLCTVDVSSEAKSTEQCKRPVEVIEMGSVKIVGEPASPGATGHLVDGINKKAAADVPYSSYAYVQSQAHAAETIRNLVVEEFLLADECNRISQPKQNVLRDHP